MSAGGSLRAGTPLRGYPSHCVGPFAREAADGYTVPKAPAGYALINVIDIVSRNIGQLQWKNLCSCQSYAYTSGLYTIRFRENVLFRTKCIFRRVLYHSNVLYGTKQHTSKGTQLKHQQFRAKTRKRPQTTAFSWKNYINTIFRKTLPFSGQMLGYEQFVQTKTFSHGQMFGVQQLIRKHMPFSRQNVLGVAT